MTKIAQIPPNSIRRNLLFERRLILIVLLSLSAAFAKGPEGSRKENLETTDSIRLLGLNLKKDQLVTLL